MLYPPGSASSSVTDSLSELKKEGIFFIKLLEEKKSFIMKHSGLLMVGFILKHDIHQFQFIFFFFPQNGSEKGTLKCLF